MEPINCLDFDDPQIHDGEIVVPIQFTRQTAVGPTTATIYLTKEKLQTLKQRADEGIELIEDI